MVDGIPNHHEYLTDDRDSENRQKLVVSWASNGDFYIGSCPEDEVGAGKMVRICCSGGAATRNPLLVQAVRMVFHALGGFEE